MSLAVNFQDYVAELKQKYLENEAISIALEAYVENVKLFEALTLFIA